MSIITMSTTLQITEMRVSQRRYDLNEDSDTTGTSSTRILGPARWAFRIGTDDNLTYDQANEWEAMLLGLRGSVNHLAAYDAGRIAPRGTMRGALTLNALASAGAQSIVLAGASGTLVPGDWLQLGSGVGTSMLVKSVGNVTASAGTATVSIEPPLRMDLAAGTAVTWDRPRGYFKAVTRDPSWSYTPNSRLQGGFSIDLLEAFS